MARKGLSASVKLEMCPTPAPNAFSHLFQHLIPSTQNLTTARLLSQKPPHTEQRKIIRGKSAPRTSL